MSEPCYTMDQAAKILNIGRNKLFATLRELKILNTENFPNREYREAGYLASRQIQYTIRSTGIKHFAARTVVTNKGMAWLGKVINQHNQKNANAAAERQKQAECEYHQQQQVEKNDWKTILRKPWTKNNDTNHCKI